MGALKIVGGILSLAGAALVLFMWVIIVLNTGFDVSMLIYLILPVIALIGGILAIAGKRAGGVLALIVGAIWLVIALLINFGVFMPWMDYLILLPEFSFFVMYLDFTIWDFLFVEIVLVFVGGILAVAGGSD